MFSFCDKKENILFSELQFSQKRETEREGGEGREEEREVGGGKEKRKWKRRRRRKRRNPGKEELSRSSSIRRSDVLSCPPDK